MHQHQELPAQRIEYARPPDRIRFNVYMILEIHRRKTLEVGRNIWKQENGYPKK